MTRIAPGDFASTQVTHGGRPAHILNNPGRFALCVLKSFRSNQGLLLAGAVAYYSLLSLVPLLILITIALSQVVDQARLLTTIGEYLEFIVPGLSEVLVAELKAFLDHSQVISGVLLVTMILFSALAFTVLENAMSVIFYHRVAIKRRRFIVSAIMPYLFILFLGLGLLIVTVVAGKLAALATHDITIFGVPHSLNDLSGYLLYMLGVVGEILILTAIYMVMPVGRLSLRHALIGGATAALLWEIARHVLAWYYGTMSQVRVLYGSMTTAILALLSVEIGAILFLLGAQVIAEYERLQREPAGAPQPSLTTGEAPMGRAGEPPSTSAHRSRRETADVAIH
jgi:YihY family inner membrane protein